MSERTRSLSCDQLVPHPREQPMGAHRHFDAALRLSLKVS